MKLLIDSNILVPLVKRDEGILPVTIRSALHSGASITVSVASLWEIAIKWRLGKLPLQIPPQKIPAMTTSLGFQLLPITEAHAVMELPDPPATRDPFDRMLLAQCEVEGLTLVTRDALLAAHRLALKI